MMAIEDEPFGTSFARLGKMTGRAILPGFGFAFVSLITLFASSSALALIAPAGLADATTILTFAFFFIIHGVFVIAIARKLLAADIGIVHALSWSSWRGGILLALAIAPFVLLDLKAASYSCADGKAYDVSTVPQLPWFLIGWAVPTVSGIPTRLACWGQQLRILWWPQRVILTAPIAFPVLFLSVPFERKIIDCTPPFDGWGLFEGGMVLIPLLGLFLFAATLGAAILAATFVPAKKHSSKNP